LQTCFQPPFYNSVIHNILVYYVYRLDLVLATTNAYYCASKEVFRRFIFCYGDLLKKLGMTQLPLEERAKAIIRFRKVLTKTLRWRCTIETPSSCSSRQILSAQCADGRVNKVTETLFEKHKTMEDYTKADVKTFENDIRSTGFYRNKAQYN